jgi:hypothetical protein
MYNQRRKRNKYNYYNSQAAALGLPYVEERPAPSWWQNWAIGAALSIIVLIFCNLVKLPSPLDVALPWFLFILGGVCAVSWLWQWNADRAYARRSHEPMVTSGKSKARGNGVERVDEDFFALPLTPAELDGGIIPVNYNGKPIELVEPLPPVNLRGFVVQRNAEMDDLSTWELLMQPDFARSTKYIGTIREEGGGK